MIEQQETRLNLHMKLVEVRKSIDAFTKDQKGFNYSYISGTQVLSKIKQKMDEHYLLLYPAIHTQEFQGYPYKDKFGKDKHDFIVHGDMSYQWVNAEKPDETMVVPWKYTGQQADISQSFGSGLTYSERYFLLKFFGVPTDEDDPDRKTYDKQDNKNKGGQQQRQPQNNNSNNTQDNNTTPDAISEGQVKAMNINLSILKKEANTTSEKLIERLEKEVGKFGSVISMTKQQATQGITLLKKWTEATKASKQEG